MYIGEFIDLVIDSILFSPLHMVDCIYYIFHCCSDIEGAGCVAIGKDVSIVYKLLRDKV